MLQHVVHCSNHEARDAFKGGGEAAGLQPPSKSPETEI
jgi:hypothetical protein